MGKKLTSRAEDYSKWYNELVVKSDLAENSGVRGCMVIKPYGYAIWEKMQGQLDEVARGLVTAFSESDPSGGLPNAVGLFTYPGAPGLPPAGTLQSGLAGVFSINAAFDPAQGGDPTLLRDGGSNGAGYIHNTTGAASYSDHMISLVQRLSANTSYDTQTGVGGDMSLNGYAAQSLGWIEGQRSAATEATLSKEALSVRLSEKLSNQTGVNIDEEAALLIKLEHRKRDNCPDIKNRGWQC